MAVLPATLNHMLHKNHELKLVTTPVPGVMCDGCKQLVKGSEHYGCAGCNFNLHTHCATGPFTLKLPLFIGGEEFTLYNVKDEAPCCACQGKVTSRGYRNEHHLYVHPCCAFLPMRVVQDDRVFQLLKDSSVVCCICKEKSQSLSYRTSCDDGQHVYLHVPCLVRTNNHHTGNQDWTASAPIVQGVRGIFPTKNNNGNGVGAVQTAITVFNALNLAFKLVTMDPEGIAQSWNNLFGGSE